MPQRVAQGHLNTMTQGQRSSRLTGCLNLRPPSYRDILFSQQADLPAASKQPRSIILTDKKPSHACTRDERLETYFMCLKGIVKHQDDAQTWLLVCRG